MQLVHSNTITRLAACVLLPLLAGCTPIVRRVDKTLLDFRGKAHVMTINNGEWLSHGRPCHPTVQTIDGTPPQPGDVVPGAHTFVVAVQWSNGWQDQTELTFEAHAGKRYWILTYELAPGEPEEKAEVRQYTHG